MLPIKQEVAVDSHRFMTSMEISQSLGWNVKGLAKIQFEMHETLLHEIKVYGTKGQILT